MDNPVEALPRSFSLLPDHPPRARKSIKTGMGSMAYLEAGQGPDVVLIHGALVTADDMALALFDALADRYHVVAFDRPGHGGSDQTPGARGSCWGQAAALVEASTMLGLRQPAIVGHSQGGAVALATAMLAPDAIVGAVALAPICFPEPRLEQLLLGARAMPVFGEALAATFGAAVDTMVLPVVRRAMFLPQGMPDPFAATFPFAWASRPTQMVADAKDSVAIWSALTRSALSYASCSAPTIIFGGTNDLVVNNAAHGLMAARLMPQSEFHWIAGAGHMLHSFPPGSGRRSGRSPEAPRLSALDLGAARG